MAKRKNAMIYVEEDLYKRVRVYAAMTGKSISGLVGDVLNEYLSKNEATTFDNFRSNRNA